MKKKNIRSINNLYIWIICIMSLILLSLVNIYFIQKFNQEKEQNINKYKQQIYTQKDILEKGMTLMFNNVYMQRSWIEDILNNPSPFNSTSLLQNEMEYNSDLNISTLKLNQSKQYKNYGNIFVDGNINNKDKYFINELEKIKNIFKFQHYLNENSILESWSTYYSAEYITIYPFGYANEIIKDKYELFGSVQESIKQLNDIDDQAIYEKGWETDIFLDNTKNVIMFSKFLPVKKEKKVVGIVANNISIDNLNLYINNYNSNINTYLVDSSGNIVYKNDKLVKNIELFSGFLEKQYNINITDDLFKDQSHTSINDYYFFTLPLDNVNWKLICMVHNNNIENWGLTRILMIIAANLMIVTAVAILLIFLSKKIKELNKIENLKAEFLMTISHDLKVPLASIIGFTEMIQKKFNKYILPEITFTEDTIMQKTVDRMNRNFSIIKEEGSRLTHMINNLLDLSKLESGEVYLKNDNIDPDILVHEVFEKMSSLLDEKGLEYKITSQPNLPSFMGDREKLLQVFINIISNSIKFTEKGSIYCDIFCNEMLVIAIKDTGIGISKNSLNQIFDKFYRCDYNSEQKKRGSGLGLAICKNIIKLHKGNIWVESEKGKGSTFFISLPIKDSRR